MTALLSRYGAGFLIGALLLLWLTSRGSHATSVWDAGVQADLHATQAWRARADSEATAAAADRARADATGDTLSRIAAAIEAFHVLPTKQADPSAVGQLRILCEAGLQACRDQTALWKAADALDQGRADSTTRYWTQADSLLRAGLKVNTCKILGLLPCPSRGLVLIVGGIAGYGAAVAARHF